MSEDIQAASHVNQIVRYLLKNEFIKSNNKDTQLITAKGLQVKETILTNRAELGNGKTPDRAMQPVAKWVWLIITSLIIAFLSKFFGWV